MPPDQDSPLGVFDSGVGGLTVLTELQRALPNEQFIYLGDTGRVPYGGKPPEMVRAFAREIADFLIGHGVKGVVIACNTASATSLPELASALPVPVWGVIEPGVSAARRSCGGGVVGILGTNVTIGSHAYQSRLEAAGVPYWAKPCPLFVPIVEEGVSDTEIAELVARHYLEDRPDLSAVILGCTHYPALKETLQKVLGEGVALVDSALETANVVARELGRLQLLSDRQSPGTIRHLVTGDLDSYLHTARVLGGPEGEVARITLAGRSRELAAARSAG